MSYKYGYGLATFFGTVALLGGIQMALGRGQLSSSGAIEYCVYLASHAPNTGAYTADPTKNNLLTTKGCIKRSNEIREGEVVKLEDGSVLTVVDVVHDLHTKSPQIHLICR